MPGKMVSGAAWCGSMRRDEVGLVEIWHGDAGQREARIYLEVRVRCAVVCLSSARYGNARLGAIRFSLVWCDKVRYNI